MRQLTATSIALPTTSSMFSQSLPVAANRFFADVRFVIINLFIRTFDLKIPSHVHFSLSFYFNALTVVFPKFHLFVLESCYIIIQTWSNYRTCSILSCFVIQSCLFLFLITRFIFLSFFSRLLSFLLCIFILSSYIGLFFFVSFDLISIHRIFNQFQSSSLHHHLLFHFRPFFLFLLFSRSFFALIILFTFNHISFRFVFILTSFVLQINLFSYFYFHSI